MEAPGTQDNEFEDLSMGDGIPDSPSGDADFGDLSFGADDVGLDFDSMDSLDLEEIDLGAGGDAPADSGESDAFGEPGSDLDPVQPGDELSADFDLDFADDAGASAADGQTHAFEESLQDSFDEVPGESLEDVSFDEVPALSDEMGFDDFGGGETLDLSDDGVASDDQSVPDLAQADSAADVSDEEPVVGTSFFDESDDETVALSEDELEDILGNTDEAFFEDFGEGEGVVDGDAGDAGAGADDALLDTEDGRLELNDIRSDDELVPEPDLEPINPPDATDAMADSDFSMDEAQPSDLEELSFDDFDAPAAGDASQADDLSVEAFSDEELELALELNDDVDGDGLSLDEEPIAGADAGQASPVPGFLDEGDDDEPIALSEDELDNIMGDVETVDAEPGSDIFGDELSGELPDDLPGAAADKFEDALDPVATEEEDENITLSDDELSQVLLDADSDDAAGGDDFAPGLDLTEDGSEVATDEDVPAPPSLSSLDMDDDEPIALTAEELGNIVSEVEGDDLVEAAGVEPDADDLDMLDADAVSPAEEPVAEMMVEEDTDLDFPEADPFAADEFSMGDEAEDLSPSIAEFENTDEDGSVALSDSELGSILEDTDTETLSAEGQPPPDEFDVAGDAVDEFADGNVIVLDEYEDDAGGADEGPVVEGPPEIADEFPEADEPDAGAAAAAAVGGLASRAEQIANESNLDREELRTMISYLDGLFDALPEDAVRQFSQSSYFDLYKKIMTELGLS